MTDASTPDETAEVDETEAVDGFDQTNGLAGDLTGDTDENSDATTDDDRASDIGSIYTGNVSENHRDASSSSDGSDGEEPI